MAMFITLTIDGLAVWERVAVLLHCCVCQPVQRTNPSPPWYTGPGLVGRVPEGVPEGVPAVESGSSVTAPPSPKWPPQLE